MGSEQTTDVRRHTRCSTLTGPALMSLDHTMPNLAESDPNAYVDYVNALDSVNREMFWHILENQSSRTI